MKDHAQHPELHGLGNTRLYDRAYRQKRGRENVAAGLTWRGNPRKRPLRPELDGLHGTPRHVRVNQLRAQAFMAQGLNWRGKTRKYSVRTDLTEIAKQAASKLEHHDFITKLQATDMLILRTEIDAFAASLGQCFHELPRYAQAQALELEKHLSAIRRRFV